MSNEDFMSVYETAAMLGVSRKTLADWLEMGMLNGVKHPAYKLTAGEATGCRQYVREDVLRAKCEMDAATFDDRLLPDVWSSRDVLAHGTHALLSQAVDRGEAILQGAGTRVTIKPVKPNGDAEPARKYLPHKRPVRALAEAGRIKSAAFPSVEFEVKEI